MLKVVIVEDEKMTILDLQDTLRRIDRDIEVVKCLTTIPEALDYFKTADEYDLIFSDIQLNDGTGFDIYRQVDIRKPIIFCTAYDEYALEAFRTNGIDYLLKPFNKQSVAKALDKYSALKANFETDTVRLVNLLRTMEQPVTDIKGSLLVFQGDKIIPVEKQHIALFCLENEQVVAITFHSASYRVNTPLDELERSFEPYFFRVNRQYLLNRKAVRDASVHFNRKLLVNLTLSYLPQIFVGKLRKTAFLDWLARY